MTYYPLLAARTDFSLGESLITASDLTKIADEVGTDVVGVTDTMTVSSLIEATKTLKKAKKRMLCGVRIRVIMQEGKEEEACYLKLYPVNGAGIQSIYRLLSRSFLSDRFYYVPRVTWGDIEQLIEDDCLAISSGDAESVIQREDMREALADLAKRKRFCARFYELVASDTPYYSRQNKLAMDFGATNPEWEPLTVMPTLWVGDTSTTYSIAASIIEKRPYEDYLRPAPVYAPMSLRDFSAQVAKAAQAVVARYPAAHTAPFGKGLKNTAELVKVCAYEWSKQEPSLPVIAKDPDAALKDMCMKGFRERFAGPVFGHRPTAQEMAQDYVPRLQFELDTLQRLGFAQYFLLVSDLVRWSKENGIFVGPGRGSVGGSLIAYLIGITDVDPVRFKLLFERFINPDRLDLPDADLDFMSTRRHEVIAYLERRWGKENVAGIVNYNTLGARSAIRDVGRICNLPNDVMGVTKFISDHHGISETLEQAHDVSFEVQEFAKNYRKVWDHALILEGKMRAYGTHAAGVVVAGEPLTNRAVVEERGSGNDRARSINWDKRVSEEQGLIKLDVLGLSTLDMFDQAARHIWKRHSKRLDLISIPLDDPETLKIFNEGKTAGIFQFEGGSVRRLLKEMAKSKMVDFEDLVALNALNRPGPLDAGLAESYIKRRAGQEPVTYPHPVLEPILKDTFGVMAYQEQIMQITRALSGFTPGEADGVRKAIGKKDQAKMAEYLDKFVDGAVNISGMARADAERLWSDIEGFAAYSFNRSHAVEYTLISYQAAWLKANYPVEFYCAQMGTTNDDKLAQLVKKAAEDGIRVIPPDINVSTNQFEPLNDTIIASPLNAVMNVSDKGVQAIIAERNSTEPTIIETSTGRGKSKVVTQTSFGPGRFVSLEDFEARVPARAINSRARENLIRVGAFARIIPGSRPSTCPTRQKDQIELMPALADQGVSADRAIDIDDVSAPSLIDLEERMMAELGTSAVPSYLGKNPKIMMIFDAPLSDVDPLPRSFSFTQFVGPALSEAGLSVDDAVWSYLIRRPLTKQEREPPAEELAKHIKYVQQEIAIMRPPVVVLLGGAAVKSFFPDMKRPSEHVGHKSFSSLLDATVIVGFKPTQIYHDANKKDKLVEIFTEAKRLIEDIS